MKFGFDDRNGGDDLMGESSRQNNSEQGPGKEAERKGQLFRG